LTKSVYFSSENVTYFYGLLENIAIQPIVNYSFYVDGLFALSTFKLALKLSRDTTREFAPFIGKHLVKFATELFIKRFFDTSTIVVSSRIWPAYAYVTLFMTLLYVRLGEGPMWSNSDIGDRCERSWLYNILLISNIIGHNKTVIISCFYPSY
jgi:hypothetical protein